MGRARSPFFVCLMLVAVLAMGWRRDALAQGQYTYTAVNITTTAVANLVANTNALQSIYLQSASLGATVASTTVTGQTVVFIAGTGSSGACTNSATTIGTAIASYAFTGAATGTFPSLANSPNNAPLMKAPAGFNVCAQTQTAASVLGQIVSFQQ